MPLPPHTFKKEIVEEEPRIKIPLYEDEKKFHIFQSSENNRMLHALQNWDWFVRDKPKLLKYLAEVTQRPIAMLRMDAGWKHRLKMENIEALESVKPNETRFRSSADYVKGDAMRAPSWWPRGQEPRYVSQEETMLEEAEEVIEFIDRNIDLSERPPEKLKGPAASFSRTNLLFCIKPGEIVERTLTINNRGHVVLFYSWERRPTQPLVLPGRKKAAERFFTLMGGTGSILPGQIRKFYFKFYSKQVGTHLENWLCRVHPKPKSEVKPVKLKGITFFDDSKLRWRTQLERILDYREMMRGIGEALHDVMETAAKASRPTAELRDRQYINSTAAFNFMRRNLRLNPPLYFTPSSFAKLETMAQTIIPQGEIVDTSSSKTQVSPTEASQIALNNETFPVEVDGESGKKDTKRKSTTKKKNKAQIMEETATQVYPPDAGADGTLRDDKTTKKKKDKLGKESNEDEKGRKKHEGKGASQESTDVSPLQIDENAPDPNVTASPRILTREDMLCKPCFDTYVRPQPPPPPPPPPPPAAWAGSVSSILLAIKACPDKKERRALKMEMRSLLEAASIPPHQTSLLLMAMYKTLHQISSDFEYTMQTVTEETGRPVAEQLLKIYFEQMEKEQELAEKAERLRDAQDDHLDWPFDEEDTESTIMAEEMRNEAKKQEAHDIVHYLMRWTHVLTEARGIVKYGANNFQEQVEKDQQVVALLIQEKIHELSSLGMDDDACWTAFDLERKKQVLQEEFSTLPESQLPMSEHRS